MTHRPNTQETRFPYILYPRRSLLRVFWPNFCKEQLELGVERWLSASASTSLPGVSLFSCLLRAALKGLAPEDGTKSSPGPNQAERWIVSVKGRVCACWGKADSCYCTEEKHGASGSSDSTHPLPSTAPHSRVTSDHREGVETERWKVMGEGLSGNLLEKCDCISVYHTLGVCWHPASPMEKWLQGQRWSYLWKAQHLAAVSTARAIIPPHSRYQAASRQLFDCGHYLPEKCMKWRPGCNRLFSSLSIPKAQPMENNFIFTLPWYPAAQHGTRITLARSW